MIHPRPLTKIAALAALAITATAARAATEPRQADSAPALQSPGSSQTVPMDSPYAAMLQRYRTAAPTGTPLTKCVQNASDISTCVPDRAEISRAHPPSIAYADLAAIHQSDRILHAFVVTTNGQTRIYAIDSEYRLYTVRVADADELDHITTDLFANHIPTSRIRHTTIAWAIAAAIPTIFSALSMLMIIGLLIMQGKTMVRYFQSPARRLDASKITPFSRIAGNEYVKAELLEIADALKRPSDPIGQLIPSGMLFSGPPGCGKTMIAAALAKESGLPFYHCSGSDFVEMFVGLGQRRVAVMFNRIRRQHRAAILFIDEIDAMARKRGMAGDGAGNEYDNTLNKLLQMMDGADKKTLIRRRRGRIVVIGATNHEEILDPALLRADRLERTVRFQMPNHATRLTLASLYATPEHTLDELTPRLIANWTQGLSGADIRGVINQARLHAARHNRNRIGIDDFNQALDLKLMGEPSNIDLDETDLLITTWHEAAHALAVLILDGPETVRTITTLPRGRSLGAVITINRENRHSQSLGEHLAMLVTVLAGRAGEHRLHPGADHNVTTGAQQDIVQASDIARALVERFGFARSIGMIDHTGEPPAAGRNRRTTSPETMDRIDDLVHRIVDQAFQAATRLLDQHDEAYMALIGSLRTNRTISGTAAWETILATSEPGRMAQTRTTIIRSLIDTLNCRPAETSNPRRHAGPENSHNENMPAHVIYKQQQVAATNPTNTN